MSAKRSFLDTIFSLYILGKFVGISCYTITKGSTKFKVVVRLSDIIQFVTFVGIFSTLTYLNLKLEMNSDENNTRIFNKAQQVQMVLSLLCVIIALFQVFLMRQRFWDIAHAFYEVDNQMMQQLNIEIDQNCLYRNTLIHLCCCCSSLVVVYTVFGYYAFAINKSAGIVPQFLTYMIINATFTLLTIQFQVLMYSMYMRLSTLNRFVKSNILKGTKLEFPSSTWKKLRENLVSVAKLTDQLNDVVPLLSQYFFTFTVSATLGVFCLTVFNFHSFYRAVTERNSSQFYFLITIYQLLGLIFSVLIFLNIFIASQISSEANRMGVMVHKIIARTHHPQFILKLKTLSMQILHRTPNISFGLFSLNWKFVFSYVASVASYLLILIQFAVYVDKNSKSDSPSMLL